MARKRTIGWVARSGEYFEGTPQEKKAQELAAAQRVNPYLPGGITFKEVRRQQQEESYLQGLLTRRAKGTAKSMKEYWANLAELKKWRQLTESYGGVGGYVAPGQYVPSAAGLSFMGGAGLTGSLRFGGRPQTSTASILAKFQPTPTPTTTPTPTMAQSTPITPTASPQEPELLKFTTPTTPPSTSTAPKPAPSYGITPQPSPQQIMPTYKPAPTTAYQSSYYQANGYKPYGYGDTFGDKSFSYAYQQPRLYQSYTGI